MTNEPLPVYASNQYRKDAKKFKHNDRLLDEIDAVIELLRTRKPLPERCQDHPLVGGVYHGFRDCHVRPDLVLIYVVDESAPEVYLFRIGTHSELKI